VTRKKAIFAELAVAKDGAIKRPPVSRRPHQMAENCGFTRQESIPSEYKLSPNSASLSEKPFLLDPR
jgi:hypothetical protein